MDQDLGLCLLTIEFPPPSPETAREASQHVMTIRLMTDEAGLTRKFETSLAWRIPMDRGAWQATVHEVARVRHNLTTTPPPPHSSL